MAQRYPELVTCDGVCDIYRPYTLKIEVVNSKPWLREVEWLENPSDRGGLVCMENDFAQGRYISMKNMSGLADLIKFDMVWGLP